VRVEPILLQQFFMRALLGDLALAQDDDLISLANGRQPVRYDETGPPPEQDL